MAKSDTGEWKGPRPFAVLPVPTTDTLGNRVTDNRGLFVLHAALLYTGKVLVFSGHLEDMDYAHYSYEFDPEHPDSLGSRTPFPDFAGHGDLFCCHMVQLHDGRILAVGGSEPFHKTTGDTSSGGKHIAFYDPSTHRWDRIVSGAARPALRQGRWYPTAVVLGSGDVLVFSGRTELNPRDPRPPHNLIFSSPNVVGFAAETIEILRAPSYAPALLPRPADKALPIYPGLHLMKPAAGPRIYFTHTTWGLEIDDPGDWKFDPVSNTWARIGPAPPTPPVYANDPRREEGMSVPLPHAPPLQGKILVIGGSVALTDDATPTPTVRVDATDTFHHVFHQQDARRASIFDTVTDTWTALPLMANGHTNGHCVLLPDSTVLIVGGHNGYKWQSRDSAEHPAATSTTDPTFESEIFDPITNTFRSVAQMGRAAGGSAGNPLGSREGSRMYHSVALLLQDGRVFVAGGADPNFFEPYSAVANLGPSEDTGNPGFTESPLNQKSFEFYEPPYFFDGDNPSTDRPRIQNVRVGGVATSPIQLGYDQQFVIETSEAPSIDRVAIMRPGCPTHHTDTEQRYVALEIISRTAAELTVRSVRDRDLAPPGYYMLWIVRRLGSRLLPCLEARWVHLVPAPGVLSPVPAPAGEP